MKVVCTINYYNYITVGKTYDVVKNYNIYGGPLEDGNVYCISDDDNFHRWVPFSILYDGVGYWSYPINEYLVIQSEEKLKELGL